MIETAEASARVLGTTFAAIRNDLGSCFCLWTGTLEVSGKGEAVRVPDEMNYYVYASDRPNEFLPIDDRERMKLSMTHDAGLLPSSDKQSLTCSE